MDKTIKKLEITDLTEDGKGVAKKDNIVYFIENATIGEIVDAKIIKEKKNFVEAIKIDSVIKSPYYINPTCTYFYNCDGCNTMDIEYEKELELKVQMVKNKLQRIGKIEISDLKIIKSKNRINFRNKIELKVDELGNVGYYLSRSHRLTPINSCVITGINTNNLIPTLKTHIKELSLKGYDRKTKKGQIKNISIRENKIGELQLTVTVNEYDRQIEELLSKLKDFENLIEIHYSINKDKNTELMKETKLFYRRKEYTDTIGNVKFKISPRSFFQVNREMTKKLYDEAVRQMHLNGDEVILDLYCGIGSTTLYFAQFAKEVIGVEIVKDAIEDAIKNKELNHMTNVKFELGKSEDLVSKYLNKVDILVVDPPRKGLDKKLIEEVSKSTIKKIMYISCNPGTLARDVAYLKDFGFTTEEVKLVDMFSNTMHVETVVLMSRK
ncbi:MAG: 23S rRNA (uracil(1939)-C(5))-methyltransferase RlmD [Lagierella massiliensis]|nr:23S rRNA (uracil(1939)-C(5))-methyltransferase RlmD [Lagierella massiliensis]